MSGLKALLQKNRERKEFIAAGNKIEDFREEPVVKPLPEEKEVITKDDEHDQCFIIVGDIHSYQRDKKAFELFMKALPILNDSYNVTKFVQLGDALEVGEASGHPVGNVFDRVPPYLEEIEWAINDFWKPAIKACPDANFYGLMGNHENRWNKKIAKDMKKTGYAQEVAIKLYNEMMPNDLYEELGIHVVPYGNETINDGILQLIPNKLLAIHGWTVAKHAAHSHLSLVQGGYSLIHGHTHRSQHFCTRNPVTGAQVEAWSFGSLAKTEMKWHGGTPNQHTLGFGLVHVHGDDFNIQQISIAQKPDGSRKAILPDGTVLQVK